MDFYKNNSTNVINEKTTRYHEDSDLRCCNLISFITRSNILVYKCICGHDRHRAVRVAEGRAVPRARKPPYTITFSSLNDH